MTKNSNHNKVEHLKEAPSVSINIKAIEAKLPPKRGRSHHIAIELQHVFKSFTVSGKHIPVLKDVDLSFYSGEFAVLYGPSGCGKSTFLHTVLGLEPPTRGKVFLREENLYDMTNDERTNFRREKIGMVFQQSNWIKSLKVWENIAYPLYLSGMQEKEAKERAIDTLMEVNLAKFANNSPMELSGGQQQRVALARALSTDPWIIIADEPTGNLDTEAGSEIISLLCHLNREKHRMILMVTHDMGFLPLATRRVAMRDGRIVFDEHD
jgi:putative ABC transport system ATP-binding protein